MREIFRQPRGFLNVCNLQRKILLVSSQFRFWILFQLNQSGLHRQSQQANNCWNATLQQQSRYHLSFENQRSGPTNSALWHRGNFRCFKIQLYCPCSDIDSWSVLTGEGNEMKVFERWGMGGQKIATNRKYRSDLFFCPLEQEPVTNSTTHHYYLSIDDDWWLIKERRGSIHPCVSCLTIRVIPGLLSTVQRQSSIFSIRMISFCFGTFERQMKGRWSRIEWGEANKA
jgi:hypothetical protein